MYGGKLAKQSSLKRVKQSEKIRVKNRKKKATIKTAIKEFEKVVEEKDLELAKKLFINCISLLDKAKNKKIFHKTKVNRIKSQLSEKLNTLSRNL